MSKIEKVTVKRVRRSADEVKTAQLERQQLLAQKAAARQERFEAQAQKAKSRAEAAEKRHEEIESNQRVRKERPAPEPIKEPIAKKVTREITSFLNGLAEKYNMSFSDVTPRLTRRGSALSIRATGQVVTSEARPSTMSRVRNAVAASREAARFIEHHKIVGIRGNVLNKQVQLANDQNTYVVIGLKGRAHDVVLKKVGGNEALKVVPADDFKTRMVAA